MDTKTSRREPNPLPATKALARLPRQEPYIAVLDFSLYGPPQDDGSVMPFDPARIAVCVVAGDAVWPSPNPSLDIISTVPRELTSREIGANKFLRAVRAEVPPDLPLRVFVWGEGTVVLTAKPTADIPIGSLLWKALVYHTARQSHLLIEATQKRDAEKANGSLSSLLTTLLDKEAKCAARTKRAKGVPA